MDLDEVAVLAMGLPGVEEGERRDGRAWSVKGKVFAWERHYSKADLKRFGSDPYPAEPVLGVVTAGLNEKEALLATSSPAVFTISHFDGYAAVLVELAAVSEEEMREVLLDGWLAKAPKALVAEYDAREA